MYPLQSQKEVVHDLTENDLILFLRLQEVIGKIHPDMFKRELQKVKHIKYVLLK